MNICFSVSKLNSVHFAFFSPPHERFVTVCTGHLENIDWPSYADHFEVEIVHYIMLKNTLINITTILILEV